MAVKISGTIVCNDDKWIYDYLGYEATCPADVANALSTENSEVDIEVNSGGGDVFAANEIYYMINRISNPTRCIITGLAASAATIICCAADRTAAVPGAQYMIHNVSSMASGDHNAMDHMSEVLKNADISITNIYRLKTGMSEAELLELMNKESWFDAKRALELKFIDEIIGNDGRLGLYNSVANIIPEETKEKLRSMIKKPEFNAEMEMIKLLKLKGEIKHV